MPIQTKATPITWAFRSCFRRGAFGWSASRLAIGRIDEALADIKAVARHDPATAADGAVLLLEKLSPALSQVDSSSGALGNAAFAAVQTLVLCAEGGSRLLGDIPCAPKQSFIFEILFIA